AVGDIVNVGSVIAVIDDGAVVAAEAPAEIKAEKPAKVIAKPVVDLPVVTGRPVPAAPATRRLARELGLDIKQIPGTGPAGRVSPEDVQAFAKGDTYLPEVKVEAAAPVEVSAETAYAAHAASAIPFLDIDPLPEFEKWGPVTREPLRSIRRKVAHKMVTSMILVPHVAHMDEADVSLLEEFRAREKARRVGQDGGKLTLLAFVIKAVTAGLKAAPSFNASLDPFKQEIVYKDFYNIGIAVDTGKGLMVPVIKETDRKSILTIAKDIERVAGQARSGKIPLDELQGGTFTITNVGPLGGTALIPTINYPEVAILGMGKVQEKPVVRDGEIVIRKILPLTLSFDHRIADGADAARFVSEMVRQLGDPNLLLLET
ncbi:MAG: 2-oxo acid dehydrogenase subunit E2, partial [FCB group bacterium]|nr:2-oxo acid dehydrogenase subunit E2 [FCB group bacterium]